MSLTNYKRKSNKGVFVLDKMYKMEYSKTYMPYAHITIEDEIRDRCKKQRIVVQNIYESRLFTIIGRKVRSKKDCEKLQEFIDKK